jgi:hypothetical protein
MRQFPQSLPALTESGGTGSGRLKMTSNLFIENLLSWYGQGEDACSFGQAGFSPFTPSV